MNPDLSTLELDSLLTVARLLVEIQHIAHEFQLLVENRVAQIKPARQEVIAHTSQ